jgi:hypothetical protein
MAPGLTLVVGPSSGACLATCHGLQPWQLWGEPGTLQHRQYAMLHAVFLCAVLTCMLFCMYAHAASCTISMSIALSSTREHHSHIKPDAKQWSVLWCNCVEGCKVQMFQVNKDILRMQMHFIFGAKRRCYQNHHL